MPRGGGELIRVVSFFQTRLHVFEYVKFVQLVSLFDVLFNLPCMNYKKVG